MNILLSCVPFDSGKSGISVYIRNLVNALTEQGHHLTLIVEHNAADFFPEYEKIILPAYCKKAIFSMVYHLFLLPLRIQWSKYDLAILTAANRRAFWHYPIKTAAVVHDLSQYHVKAKYDIFRMYYIQHVLPFFVRRAQKIVAISKSTQSDLIKYWHIPAEKTSVIYNGLSLAKNSESEIETHWRQDNALQRPYILYISRLEHPGKNHVGLIQAFNKLPAEIAEQYDLVMPGAEWSGAEEIHKEADASPYKEHIKLTGFIKSEELKEAYINAACYVFPSHFEGFGLSLVEAMHYGAPCACSNTSSLGEIGQDAALLFSPDDTDEMSTALIKILTDTKIREYLIGAGHNRAAMFSWSKTAQQITQL